MVVELGEGSHLPPKVQALCGRLLNETRRVYGDELLSVAVFGSLARGMASPDADVDVLIVARGMPMGRMARVEQFLPIEEAIHSSHPEFRNIELSPILKTPQ